MKTGLISALALLAATAANAQEVIRLTVGSGYTNAASYVGAFEDTYIPRIDEELAKTGNYKIDWNVAFGGQIAQPRGELEAIESGLLDLGIVVTAFHTDKLPLYSLSYLTPFTSTDVQLVSKTISELSETYPQFQQEWGRLNQKVLVVTGAVDRYQVYSTVPLAGPADLQGLKVGAAGANLEWVKAAGAAGVPTNLNEAYSSLDTGIYQAGIFWANAAGNFKICEPAPYILDPGFGAVQSHAVSFNLDSWNGLPDEVQEVFRKVAPEYQQRASDIVNAGAESGWDICTSQFSAEKIVTTADQSAEWAASLPNAAQRWAETLENRGIPGTEILSAYMQAMRDADQQVTRDWDKQ